MTGGCWWYGSRRWTFLLIFCVILLFDRWQYKGRQTDRMASGTEVCMQQRYVTDLLGTEKISPTDIHWHLLNIYGDQTVDVNTVVWCVSAFETATWKTGQVLGSHADFHKHVFQSFVHCWQKFIATGGEYVEKYVEYFVAENLLCQYCCTLCVYCSFHGTK